MGNDSDDNLGRAERKQYIEIALILTTLFTGLCCHGELREVRGSARWCSCSHITGRLPDFAVIHTLPRGKTIV